MTPLVEPVAVYVHIPFCPSKCGYCDFNSYAMEGEIVPRTVSAIREEIRRSPHRGRPAKSIFFGGGTPTFIPSADLCALLEDVLNTHPPTAECEVTSEANPGTVDASKFADMAIAGFNRVSIGGQTFDQSELALLGRVHGPDEIGRAVDAARSAGFANVSVDFMFALPTQTMTRWRRNLARAIDLQTDHLSLYCLTIEPNTAFYKLQRSGALELPDDEQQVEMYDMATQAMEDAGYRQYEISNFAKPGFECKHNLAYWRNEEYIGYGPGAVERVGSRRWTHVKHPRAFCEAVESGTKLSCEEEPLDPNTRERERIMLGIRLSEGVEIKNGPEVETLRHKGWLVYGNGRATLTRQGRHYCNEVIVALFDRTTSRTPIT